MSQQSEPLIGLLDTDAARTALICPDADVRLSHGELAELVDGLAGTLQAAGVGPGDRVAVVLPNGAEIVAMLFALASLGAAIAPLNPAYTEPEYRFYLDDLDPQLLLIGESAAPNGAGRRGRDPYRRARAAAPGHPVAADRRRPSCRRRRLAGGGPATSRCCCTPAARPRAPSRCRCCSAT